MKNLLSLVCKTIYHIGMKRSDKWHTIRKHHIEKEGWCKYCGGTTHLEVHHIEPFHLNPDKELDDTNLITLCEDIGKDCHLKVGHLGNWKNFNPNVRKIADSPSVGMVCQLHTTLKG